MSGNLSPGLPYRTQRDHELQPRDRSEDYVEPLYLDDQGRKAFRSAPQLMRQVEVGGATTLVDLVIAHNLLVRAWNKMLVSDAEAGLREH